MENITTTQKLVRKPAEPKAPPQYDGADLIFVCIIPVLGFLFIKLVAASALAQPYPGAGVTAYTLCFIAVVLAWFRRSGGADLRAAWPGLVAMLLTGGYFAIYQNAVLGYLALPLLIGTAAYTVVALGGRRAGKTGDDYLVFDLYGALCSIPFGNFGKLFAICGDRLKKVKKSRSILMMLLGVVAALPVAIYVGTQLQSADAAFEMVWQSFVRRFFSDDLLVTLLQIAVSIPVGMYLYGLIYGSVKHRGEPHLSSEEAAGTTDKAKILPLYLVIGGITPLLALYLMFFFSQTAYFLSAFRGILPLGLNYSEYARRGFFELCNVCVINLLVAAVLNLLTKDSRAGAVSRVYGCLLALSSLALIAISLSKMLMYISIYGLTPLRVYTSWFMVFLFLLFAMLIVRLFKPGFPFFKYGACCCLAMFLLLGYADTDRLIAEYNLEAYRTGKVAGLDVDQLRELGGGGVGCLLSIAADESMPEEYKRQAGQILYAKVCEAECRKEYKRDDWRGASIAGYREHRLLMENKDVILRAN
ncbi:MAG: DUF4173 domain-containing protein [Clostridiales bacterium]|nr:DUF4173 domain-containing protein [Clostridiales bacterium]